MSACAVLRLGLWSLAALLVVGCADAPDEALRLAERGLYAGAIGPEGDQLALGSLAHGGSLWRVDQYARRFDWNLNQDRDTGGYTPFTALAFSGDGNRVATVYQRQLVIWSAQSGESLAYFEAPARIRAVALDRSGDRLLVGLDDGLVLLYEALSGDLIQRLKGHRAAVNSLALSADGRSAVSGGDDFQALAWDLGSGQIVSRVKHDNRVSVVALSPDRRYILSAAQGENAQVWRWRDGTVVRRMPTAHTVVSSARFLPDSQQLMLGNRRHGVEIWALQELKRTDHWRLGSPSLYGRESQVVLDVIWLGDHGLALSSGGSLALLR